MQQTRWHGVSSPIALSKDALCLLHPAISFWEASVGQFFEIAANRGLMVRRFVQQVPAQITAEETVPHRHRALK